MSNKREQIVCPVCLKKLPDKLIGVPQCDSCKLFYHDTCGDPMPKGSLGVPIGPAPVSCNKCNKYQEDKEEQNKRMKKIENQESELRNELDDLKHQPRKPEETGSPVAAGLIYVIVFVLAVVSTGLLVRYGWVTKPQVSIQYNVGEIIGGLLVGAGALAAGVAYALRSLGVLRKR